MKGVCLDNVDYMFNLSPDLTCKKIGKDEAKRKIYCQIEEVSSYCRQACGLCCKDDESYTFDLEEKENADCYWIFKDNDRVEDYCDERLNGEKVKYKCTDTCDNCKVPVPLYPCTCEDDRKFRWAGNDKYTCNWVRNDEDRRQLMCSTNPEVRSSCPLACGECCVDNEKFKFTNDQGSVSSCESISKRQSRIRRWCDRYVEDINTSEMTMIRRECPVACSRCSIPVPVRHCVDDKEFKFLNDSNEELMCEDIEKYKRADKWCCKKVPDISQNGKQVKVRAKCPLACDACFNQPSDPTAAPSPTPKTPDFCKDDPDFLLYPQLYKKASCQWLAKKDYRRQDFCHEKKVRSSCPFTCGKCCEDDPSFVFLHDHGAEVGCDYLSKSKKRKDKWCSKQVSYTKYGETIYISDKCPKTCQSCFEPVSKNLYI